MVLRHAKVHKRARKEETEDLNVHAHLRLQFQISFNYHINSAIFQSRVFTHRESLSRILIIITKCASLKGKQRWSNKNRVEAQKLLKKK